MSFKCLGSLMKLYLEDVELLHVPGSIGYFCSFDSVFKLVNKSFVRVKDRFIDMSDFWSKGDTKVPFEKLIVAAYYKIKLPFKYISRIEVMYKDGNDDNKNWYNMYYRFPDNGIESDKSGYYFIPYYTSFVINKEGILLNYNDNKVIEGKSNGGYVIYSSRKDFAFDDFGNHIKPLTVSIGRYRLLALAFIPFCRYPFDKYKMEVNHIDGIKNNDKLSNLEWVDRRGNLDHAMRNNLREDNNPVFVLDYFTNEVREHYSIEEAARVISEFIPVDGETIRQRLINFDQRAVIGRYSVQYKCNNPVWLYPDLRSASEKVAKLITFKNIFTGDVHTCFRTDNVQKFIKEKYGIKIKKATISFHVQYITEKNEFPTPHQGFFFKPIFIENEFPVLSELELKFYSRAFEENLRLSDNRPIIVIKNNKYFSTCINFPETIKVTGMVANQISDLISGVIPFYIDKNGNKWELFRLYENKTGLKLSEKGHAFLRENEITR